jgi:hypothetical protein
MTAGKRDFAAGIPPKVRPTKAITRGRMRFNGAENGNKGDRNTLHTAATVAPTLEIGPSRLGCRKGQSAPAAQNSINRK